jgi:DnaK suppressor protein
MGNALMLTEDKKDYFKGLLTRWLEERLADKKDAIRGFAEPKDELPDFLDQAFSESDTSFAFRIKERQGRLIQKIEEALELIEEGTFGICEECGEEISEERLMARPVTTLCIQCKRRMEAQERIRGL